MAFDYLAPTRQLAGGADRRARVAAADVAHRAALLYRLGFTQQAAVARLSARIAWEFDPPSAPHHHGHHQRPASLSDEAIAKIVADTYARKPGHAV